MDNTRIPPDFGYIAPLLEAYEKFEDSLTRSKHMEFQKEKRQTARFRWPACRKESIKTEAACICKETNQKESCQSTVGQ